MNARYDAASRAALSGGYTRLAGGISARRATLLDFHFSADEPLRCCVCARVMPVPAAACADGWYYTPDLCKRLVDSFYCPPCAELEQI